MPSPFLTLATTTGLGQGAVRFFSAYQRKASLSSYFAMVFRSVGLMTLGAASIAAVVLILTRSLIRADVYPLLWAALALYVVTALFSTLADILRGQERSRWYSAIWVSQHYSGVILGLVLVLVFKMGIGGLIWGQTLALLISVVPLIWLTTHSMAIGSAQVNRDDFRQLWAFSLPYSIGNLAFWTLSLSDRYIVEAFRGSYEVGLYAVANKISSRSIQLLVSLFFLVPAPIVSRLWEERGRQPTEEALTTFTRMFLLMVVPAVVGLAVVAVPLVGLLADEAYFSGHTAIWLVACAAMGLGLSDLGSIGCMVTNHTRLIARNQCIAAGVGLVLNLILVPALGFLGAAVSAAISFLLLAALQAFSSRPFLTWRWPLGSLWRVAVASGAMACAVLLLQMALRSDTTGWQITYLLLSILAGALIYGVVLWALGEVSPRQLLDLLAANRSRVPSSPVTGDGGQRL